MDKEIRSLVENAGPLTCVVLQLGATKNQQLTLMI